MRSLKHASAFVVILLIAAVSSSAQVKAQNAEIKEEGVHFGQGLNGILCIPEKTPAPVIVLCPSMGEQHGNESPYTESLCKMGYNVLVFDPRGFQYSGKRFTFESGVEDTMSAVGFLQLRDEVIKDRIGVFRASLGASVAIQAAARDERIRAVALLGLPVDFKETASNFPEAFCERQ